MQYDKYKYDLFKVLATRIVVNSHGQQVLP